MKFFLSFVLLVASLANANPTGPIPSSTDRELSVHYSTPAEVESLLSNQSLLFDVKKVAVQGATGGTIRVSFARTFSNKCVAGANVISPEAAISNNNVKVALGHSVRKIACPAVFQPVLVNFHFTLRGLKSGGTYKVVIGTKQALVKKRVLVP